MEETLQKKTDKDVELSLKRHQLCFNTNWRTLNIVLEDLREDGEERFLKTADSSGVRLAGDADRQAQGLKQVVVKVRFAGILKADETFFNTWCVSPQNKSICIYKY